MKMVELEVVCLEVAESVIPTRHNLSAINGHQIKLRAENYQRKTSPDQDLKTWLGTIFS